MPGMESNITAFITSRPSDTELTRPTFIQVINWWLYRIKPLSAPLLTSTGVQLDPYTHMALQYESKYYYFHSKVLILQECLQHGCGSVSVLMR